MTVPSIVAGAGTTAAGAASGAAQSGQGGGAATPFAQLLAALGLSEDVIDGALDQALAGRSGTEADSEALLQAIADGLDSADLPDGLQDIDALLTDLAAEPDAAPALLKDHGLPPDLIAALSAFLDGDTAALDGIMPGDAVPDGLDDGSAVPGTTEGDALVAAANGQPGAGQATDGDGPPPAAAANVPRAGAAKPNDAAASTGGEPAAEGDILIEDGLADGPRRSLGGGDGDTRTLTAAPAPSTGAATGAKPAATALEALATAASVLQDANTRGQPADPTALAQALDASAQMRPGDTQPVMQRYPQPTAPVVPVDALAVTILREGQAGNRRFEIQLDPPELGRVDVRLELMRDGRVQTHLTVERPETLDQLVRDARQLERALSTTGMKLDDGGVQFSLKDDAPGGGQDFAGRQRDDGSSPSWAGGRDDADAAEPAAATTLILPARDGLDLQI